MYAHHDGPMRYTEEGSAFYDPIGSREPAPQVLGVNRNLLIRGYAGTGNIVDEFIDFWSTPDPTVLDEVVVEGDPNSQVAPPGATVTAPVSPLAPPRGSTAPLPGGRVAEEKKSIVPYVILGAVALAGLYVVFGGNK